MQRTTVSFIFTISLVIACKVEGAPCDSALVESTYNSFDTDHIDYRLLTLVTEKEWDQISHDAGASAIIYGVPVSATYKDFHNSASEKLNLKKTSLTHDQSRNILWTGLDPNGVGAYKKCLDAEVFSQRGLHMAVKSATDNDIAILISYKPEGNDPSSLTPLWKWADPGKKELPKTVTQGFTTAVIPRPKQVHTLAVNFPGTTDSVVIEPLEKLPKLPPQAPFVTGAEQYKTNLLASGACAAFGQWASVCSPDKPEGWTIISQHFSIIGDRAGGAYAEVQQVGAPTSTKVCYQFRTQGHNEECGHGGNTGIQNSTGVLDVDWQHH